MNPLNGDLVLSGFSIRASRNLGILGVQFDSKLAFEVHVRGIVSPRLKENWYFEVGEAYLFGHLYATSLLLYICSHNP